MSRVRPPGATLYRVRPRYINHTAVCEVMLSDMVCLAGGIGEKEEVRRQVKGGMRKDWPGEELNNRASKAIFIPKDNNKLLNYNRLIEVIMTAIRQQWDSMETPHSTNNGIQPQPGHPIHCLKQTLIDRQPCIWPSH